MSTNPARDAILAAVRKNRPAPVDLPKDYHAWTTFPDPRAKFIEVLELVGGNAIVARDIHDLNSQLVRLPQLENASKIASLIPGLNTANTDLAAIDSPHGLNEIDVAILPGEFAVAENAAVWVNDQHLPLRVLYFLCQHLVLVLPASQILPHMHAAYERLGKSRHGSSEFSQPTFGAFISGPSKTADIEQTLVIGAHGPRSLMVCFLES